MDNPHTTPPSHWQCNLNKNKNVIASVPSKTSPNITDLQSTTAQESSILINVFEDDGTTKLLLMPCISQVGFRCCEETVVSWQSCSVCCCAMLSVLACLTLFGLQLQDVAAAIQCVMPNSVQAVYVPSRALCLYFFLTLVLAPVLRAPDDHQDFNFAALIRRCRDKFTSQITLSLSDRCSVTI